MWRTAVDELIRDPEHVCHGLRHDLKGGVLHLGRKVSLEQDQDGVDDVEAALQHELWALLAKWRLDILRTKQYKQFN